jgi:hypothetical protein
MKKKTWRLAVPLPTKKNVKISASYRKITIRLQEAIVDEARPATLYFYLDSRFTAEQEEAIKRILLITIYSWGEYFDEVSNNGTSSLKMCAQKYARFNLSPVWFDEKLANGGVAVDIMMSAFTTAFLANGFGRSAKAYIIYEIPKKGSSFTIKAANSSDPEKSSLSVTVNPQMLENIALPDGVLAGSLWHAWMHRLGYRHPVGKYAGYFIGEVPLCIMRGYLEKQPTRKDSRFTHYLD